MRLNLGCGNDYRDGYVNVDLNNNVRVDEVVDLENEMLPWADSSCEEIIANHLVEHIWKRDRFMNECWRVLKPGGKMHVETPTAGTVAYWKDPTHVSGWIPQTFRYYCDWNTDKANGRKTWLLESCETLLKGDENEHIVAVLVKPYENLS